MWKTPPYGQKTLLKSKKNIFQISHLIFWKLQAAKYLIYDFTFTLSFFFIWSKLNWALFHLSGIFGCEKNDGQGWHFRLKYLDVEKMRDKVPKSLMTSLPLLLLHSAMVAVVTNISYDSTITRLCWTLKVFRVFVTFKTLSFLIMTLTMSMSSGWVR